MRVVTVPVQLVNLLREVLVEEVANCAEEIKDSGHSHPDFGIDPQELEDFEVYRALLEQVGAIRTTPTVAVELRLRRRAHRAALTAALHRRVEFVHTDEQMHTLLTDAGFTDIGVTSDRGALALQLAHVTKASRPVTPIAP